MEQMKKAWFSSKNGTSGKEAGFAFIGTPDHYLISPVTFSNETGSKLNLPNYP
jgi:hypothetical protein